MKDVNQLLDKYEGTWIGNYDNKAYYIVINKVTQSFNGMKGDRLLLRYKISDKWGSEIISTLNLPNNSIRIVEGKQLKNGGDPNEYYVLFYQGKSYECRQIGNMYISIPADSPHQLNLSLVIDKHSIRPENCLNDNVQQLFPAKNESMQLTKQ